MPPRRRKRRSTELRNGLRLGLVMAGLVAVNIYVFFFKPSTALREVLKPASSTRSLKGRAEIAAEAAGPLPPSPAAGGARAVEGEVGASDTLAGILEREGFGAASDAVVQALARVMGPRRLHAGEAYGVRFDGEGAPAAFEYRPAPGVIFRASRSVGGGWAASEERKPLEVRTAEVAGGIEPSLYQAVRRAGAAGALADLLVDVFAWDIDFFADARPGDRWKVIVEKQVLGEELDRYGRILAAEYTGAAGTFRAFYWKPGAPSQAPGRYYDERGQAVARTFLKTPLRFEPAGAKLDLGRPRPVLRREGGQLGVDYPAPAGTPVWAIAGGKVVEVEREKRWGNTVAIAHADGITTRYARLSRFARGLKRGQQVRQKEIIGYLGTSGLDPAPRLRFSATRNGIFVDPGGLGARREPSVPDRAAFLKAIEPRLAALKALGTGKVARN